MVPAVRQAVQRQLGRLYYSLGGRGSPQNSLPMGFMAWSLSSVKRRWRWPTIFRQTNVLVDMWKNRPQALAVAQRAAALRNLICGWR